MNNFPTEKHKSPSVYLRLVLPEHKHDIKIISIDLIIKICIRNVWIFLNRKLLYLDSLLLISNFEGNLNVNICVKIEHLDDIRE